MQAESPALRPKRHARAMNQMEAHHLEVAPPRRSAGRLYPEDPRARAARARGDFHRVLNDRSRAGCGTVSHSVRRVPRRPSYSRSPTQERRSRALALARRLAQALQQAPPRGRWDPRRGPDGCTGGVSGTGSSEASAEGRGAMRGARRAAASGRGRPAAWNNVYLSRGAVAGRRVPVSSHLASRPEDPLRGRQ